MRKAWGEKFYWLISTPEIVSRCFRSTMLYTPSSPYKEHVLWFHSSTTILQKSKDKSKYDVCITLKYLSTTYFCISKGKIVSLRGRHPFSQVISINITSSETHQHYVSLIQYTEKDTISLFLPKMHNLNLIMKKCR